MRVNLTSYAVMQKIKRNDSLLDYVVSKKPIPIDTLEVSLQPLLGEGHSFGDDLISDYEKYLIENYPIGLVKTGDNTYAVTGDIPDTVVNVIELLHGVKADDIVKALVNRVINDLHGERDVELIDIVYSESVVEPTIVNIQPTDVAISEDSVDDMVVPFEVDEEQDSEQDASPVDEGSEIDEGQVDELVDVDLDVEVDVDVETESDETDLDFDELFEVEDPSGIVDNLDVPDELFEEVRPEIVSEREALQRVYDETIKDIEDRGLDTALNLEI